MKKIFKKQFALTDQGASDLIKSTIACFMMYVTNLLPAILLMMLVDQFLFEHIRSRGLYIGLSLGILAVMYLLLGLEYDALYTSTYKEGENLRVGIAQNLIGLPLSFFSKHDLSDISQTIMKDVDAIEHALSHAMAKVSAFFLFLPLVSVLLLIGNFKLGLAVVLPILFFFAFTWQSKQVQIKEHKKYYAQLRANSESFQEAIEMQQDIKSYGLGNEVRQKLYQQIDQGEKIQLTAEKRVFVPIAISNFFLQLCLGIVIVVGINLYIAEEISLLYFLGYLLATMRIKEAIDTSAQNIAELFYLDAQIQRINEIRNTEIQTGEEVNLQTYDIELKNVSFSYNEDTEVLKDVSFTAGQGQVTALVGMSGCGKTSILRLVSRLYDYDSGKILIGGKDIKEISTDSLFENISIVFQDVTLFNSSVLENIRIGRREATDEEVKAAARLANCEEFINKLPNGYDSLIGENGASLSGGERQRLSIARAFLKNSPIIILDEIASALDVENEKKIQDSLNQLIKDKTVLIITHRMKSIENVDKIVVIDQGKVESYGKHKELLTKSPIYQSLVQNAKLAENFQY
ncbi:ABC transporter ATP-binding protein [Clostridiales bacterium COT073_COT-073]|nr:ABC transporter ATP-binding protein [Clostridiales bacterium COT073_COT-073]